MNARNCTPNIIIRIKATITTTDLESVLLIRDEISPAKCN